MSSMSIATPTFTLVIHSCRDLPIHPSRFWQSVKAYATAEIAGRCRVPKQRTDRAEIDGPNPVFNCSMRFHVPNDINNSLIIEIKDSSSDTTIGIARIPFSELGSSGDGVEYDLLTPSAGKRGVVIISYHFFDPSIKKKKSGWGSFLAMAARALGFGLCGIGADNIDIPAGNDDVAD